MLVVCVGQAPYLSGGSVSCTECHFLCLVLLDCCCLGCAFSPASLMVRWCCVLCSPTGDRPGRDWPCKGCVVMVLILYAWHVSALSEIFSLLACSVYLRASLVTQ